MFFLLFFLFFSFFLNANVKSLLTKAKEYTTPEAKCAGHLYKKNTNLAQVAKKY